MESVIIVTGPDCDLARLRQAIPPGYKVEDAANGRVLIENAGRRAYLGPDARIASELEPEESSRVRSMIREPTFFSLDFSDIGLCRELLMAIADRGDVLIDNDHGVLLRGSEFVRVLRSQTDWDWRRDPLP
jgi:hypothetical protein